MLPLVFVHHLILRHQPISYVTERKGKDYNDGLKQFEAHVYNELNIYSYLFLLLYLTM